MSPEARAILSRMEEGRRITAARFGERARRRIVRALRGPAFGTGAHEVRAAGDEARKAGHYALAALALREALR